MSAFFFDMKKRKSNETMCVSLCRWQRMKSYCAICIHIYINVKRLYMDLLLAARACITDMGEEKKKKMRYEIAVRDKHDAGHIYRYFFFILPLSFFYQSYRYTSCCLFIYLSFIFSCTYTCILNFFSIFRI